MGLLAAFGSTPRAGNASEQRMTPSVAAQVMYDDNIFFDDESGFVTTVTPALQYKWGSEKGHVRFSGQGDIYQYAEHDEYDRVNQGYTIDARHAFNEYWTFGMNAQARFDYTFAEQLEETGQITDKEKRTRFSGKPAITLTLSPRLSTRLEGRYLQVAYDDPEERDYATYGGSLALIREWGPRTTVSGSLAYSFSDVADQSFLQFGAEVGNFDQTQQTWQGLLQLNHEWYRTLQFSLGGGVSYSKTELEQRFLQQVGPYLALVRESASEDYTGAVFEAGLDWQQERYSIHLSCGRSITQDVEGDNRIRDRASVSGTCHFTDRMRVNTGASFVRSEEATEEAAVDPEKTRSYGLHAGIFYMLSGRADISLGYDIRVVDDAGDAAEDESDTRNQIWLELTWQFSLFPEWPGSAF